MVIYRPHLRLVGELEDERRANRLSVRRAGFINAERCVAYYCTILHWHNGLDVLNNRRLQTAMVRRERGVEEAAIRADMIKLFPATVLSVWQDPL